MHVTCPNCGESFYAVKYSTQTAMYFPAIYKDGVNQNPDGNITTTQCECINCHYTFSYREQYGKVLDISLGPKVTPLSDTIIMYNPQAARDAEIRRLEREIESLKDRLAEVRANPEWHMETYL